MSPRVRRLGLVAVGWSAGVALLVGATAARQLPPTGEELYIDRLGCWNCHGKTGEGGGAQGPALLGTELPLRQFFKAVRLPGGTMPPVAPVLASDEELAILYRWLQGREPVELLRRVAVTVLGSKAAGTALGTELEQAKSVEIEVRLAGPIDQPKRDWHGQVQRYRFSLFQPAGPLAQHAMEYRVAAQGAWSNFATDEHGEALLGPEGGVAAIKSGGSSKQPLLMWLRTSLAPGRYLGVFEVVDYTDSSNPVVVGVGSALVNVG